MRRLLVWTGLVGLAANALLLTAVIVARGVLRLRPLLGVESGVAVTLFVLAISCAEIPLMVYGLRRLAADPNGASRGLCGVMTAFYVFFAAVYGTVVLALTGWWAAGLGLSALGLARLASTLWFVPDRPK
jgi:hypothetical protein